MQSLLISALYQNAKVHLEPFYNYYYCKETKTHYPKITIFVKKSILKKKKSWVSLASFGILKFV